MKRTLLVFCLSCLFVIPGFLSAQAENEPGLIKMGLSSEFLDSLMGGKGGEPTLQEILDSLGYDIDVENDKLPTEIWEVIASQYSEVMLAEVAGYSDQTASGWYVAGNPDDTTVIFTGESVPPDTEYFYITGCDSNGLFIAPFAGGGKCDYVYYTEPTLNPDQLDHAWVFCSKKRPNEFVIAWEDVINLGDGDYNDLVLVYQMPNRAPVLEVPDDTSFFLCEPETICFDNISAYDLDYCGDTVVITKVQGPGTYDAGTCCFLPASVDSVYEFVFVATDWFGAADTDTVVITVDITKPVLSCAGDELTCDSLLASATVTSDPSVGVSYLWTPAPVSGQGTAHARYDAPGTKKVVVEIDATGCKDSCNAEITQDIDIPDLTCQGDELTCDSLLASATVTSDPSVGVSYLWTPAPVSGQGTAHARYDAPGTKKVVVEIDATGCKDSCNAEITQDITPPVCEITGDNVVCEGFTTEFCATPGMADYEWSGPPGFVDPGTQCTGQIGIEGLYTVIITDANGCKNTCGRTLVQEICDGNKVIIPNFVYERFGFGHWDYFPWDCVEPDCPNDNYIILDDACPPYYGINPGDYFEIPIILEGSAGDIGAFHFEVEFDYVDLTFFGAERGGLLAQRMEEDGVLWSWEYFSYRLCPCAYPGCLKYKIEIFGQAEMPDGLFRRGYCLASNPDTPEEWWYTDQYIVIEGDPPEPTLVDIGATLVWLKFQVANNELLRDLKLPIIFEWDHKLCQDEPGAPYYICQDWDCAENTMSNCDGDILYVSDDWMQYSPAVCGMSQEGGGDIDTILTFIDGGVHICSPCTAFKCVRGDINLNHIAYDPADPVLLSRAIIFGEYVVFWDIDVQICASDVNADGRPLMLADLIYMIRVIQNDAIPYPKLGPSSEVANLIVADDRVSVECASPVGGLLFVFDGAVTPTLLATDMELLAHEGRVLVWSRDGNSIDAGVSEILSVTGADLVSVTAVDRESRDLATTITTKVAPLSFALHNSYPNPFNPYTNLSFTLPNATAYRLNIYNVAGQLVRSYEGMGTAGLNVVTWDGKNSAGNDISSGIYFYKLVAGQHSAIKKMIMLK
jgi:hypothetical protein